ncbi:sensor histidine kinase [Flagellimonas sp.]|uniref:sensor histidine kinase n=1 Tax=Flagellimonas sp. TaxID=2058762 RepID=UPI0026B6AA72
MRFTRLYDPLLNKLLIAFYTAFLFISFLKKAILKLKGVEGYDQSWYDIIVDNILWDWLMVILFMTLISMLTKYLLEKQIRWKRILLIHFIFSILLSFFIFYISYGILLLFGQISIAEYFEGTQIYNILAVMDYNFLIYFSMTCLIYAYYYFSDYKQKVNTIANYEKIVSETELNLLKAQLQPHFIFNTLNAIYILIDKSRESAKRSVLNLSELLRESIKIGKRNMVPLHMEIEMVDKYVDLLKIRYNDDLNFGLKVQKELDSYLVPNLILQPILENAVKHGFGNNHLKLDIHVIIEKLEEELVLIIKNDGVPLTYGGSDPYTKGLGIQNVKQRLEHLYHDAYSFTMYNENNWVVVRITIPIRKT